MKKILNPVLLLTLLLSTNLAAAASLFVSGGKLAGANDVLVNGNFYNVRFLEGSCANVFTICDVPSFTFRNQTDASMAAQVLLDQVLIFPYARPEQAAGISATNYGFVFTPYTRSTTNVIAAAARNAGASPYIDEVLPNFSIDASVSGSFFDYSSVSDQHSVWAQWTPTLTTVPLPATMWLFCSGLAALAGFRKQLMAG